MINSKKKNRAHNYVNEADDKHHYLVVEHRDLHSELRTPPPQVELTTTVCHIREERDDSS